CRLANGGAGGTCNAAVAGFNCTEGRRQSVPGVQYNATVDCRKGDAEIKSTYTQNFQWPGRTPSERRAKREATRAVRPPRPRSDGEADTPVGEPATAR